MRRCAGELCPANEAQVLTRVAELKQRIACCPLCGDKGIVVLERGGWCRPPVLERCVCVPF